MKDKTKNFDMLINEKYTDGGNIQTKSMKQTKSYKNIKPKINDLINYSQNKNFDKESFKSGNKSQQQMISNLKKSEMLAGYLSDRNIHEKTIISQFNEFSKSKHLEFKRKSSTQNLSSYTSKR